MVMHAILQEFWDLKLAEKISLRDHHLTLVDRSIADSYSSIPFGKLVNQYFLKPFVVLCVQFLFRQQKITLISHQNTWFFSHRLYSLPTFSELAKKKVKFSFYGKQTEKYWWWCDDNNFSSLRQKYDLQKKVLLKGPLEGLQRALKRTLILVVLLSFLCLINHLYDLSMNRQLCSQTHKCFRYSTRRGKWKKLKKNYNNKTQPQ